MVQGLAGIYAPTYTQLYNSVQYEPAVQTNRLYQQRSLYDALDTSLSSSVEAQMPYRTKYAANEASNPQSDALSPVGIQLTRSALVYDPPQQQSRPYERQLPRTTALPDNMILFRLPPIIRPQLITRTYMPVNETEDYSMNKQDQLKEEKQEQQGLEGKRKDLARKVLQELEKLRPQEATRMQEPHQHDDGTIHAHY